MSVDLHDQVDHLFPGVKRRLQRTLLHALIDLGHVTVIKCMWDRCVIPDQALTPEGRRNTSVTFDHTLALNDGGTDDWRNIQLMHFTCNTRKGALFTDERREKLSETLKQRWADPEYRAKMSRSQRESQRRPETVAKRSSSMKAHWSDPQRRAQHIASYARGEDHWLNKPGARDLINCEVCGRPCKGIAARTQHMTKMHRS